MSNESMPSEPAASEPAPGDPASRVPGRSVDAALALAAIDRMDAAIQHERATLDRLHTELKALAQTIARAKIAVRAGAVKVDALTGSARLDVAGLLDELEHRVDAMLEIGNHSGRNRAPAQDHAPLDRPAAERATDEPAKPRPHIAPDRVPTVSEVVSRLGREDDHQDDEPRKSAGAPAPQVGRTDASMLEAMVQALSALDAENHGSAAPAPAPAPPPVPPRPKKPVIPENELTPAPAPTSKEPLSDKRPDPLAPLNAMSAAEKLALFS
jgi:hypothetical protein